MIKKRHIFFKTTCQISIYLFELVFVSLFLTYLSNCYLEPISSVMDFVERMILSYTIYQIIVIVILSNLNDIRKDSALALLTTLKYCLLYIDSKSEDIKTYILHKIDNQLDNGTFNNLNFREVYLNLKDNLDNLNRIQIECEIINTEHALEYCSLNWRFSFLLRIFK